MQYLHYDEKATRITKMKRNEMSNKFNWHDFIENRKSGILMRQHYHSHAACKETTPNSREYIPNVCMSRHGTKLKPYKIPSEIIASHGEVRGGLLRLI